MAGAGKKTFTAGEVLTASDVNTYLMEQSVMVFGGTAARASAIPTPTEGMTSYIGTTGTASIPQIETYTGSEWQTPYGLTLVNTSTFTTAAAIQVDNCFTSAFDNYRLIFDLRTMSVGDTSVNVQFVDGTTPRAASYFFGATGVSSLNATTTSVGNGTAFIRAAVGHNTASDATGFSMDIVAPLATARTKFFWNGYNYNGGVTFSYVGGGIQDEALTFEGIRITPNSGTFGGIVSIYGYRKS